jgi:DNA-binding response OmpR family regulator
MRSSRRAPFVFALRGKGANLRLICRNAGWFVACMLRRASVIAAPPHTVVFLVASDPAVRASLVAAIEGAGALVVASPSAARARSLAMELLPDAVVVASRDEETQALLELAAGALQIVDVTDPATVHARLLEAFGAQHTPVASPGATSTSGTRRTAFAVVVEDDAVLAGVLAGVLSDAGFAVRRARTMREGKQLLSEHPTALLVLDLTLPDAFGGEILSAAAQLDRVPPTVIVSAFGLAELIARSFDAELVRKPFELDAFVAAVARAQAKGFDGRERALR